MPRPREARTRGPPHLGAVSEPTPDGKRVPTTTVGRGTAVP